MPEFEVERFEGVSATPETTLLRIAGRWHAEQRERLSPPMLVLDDGRRTHRLSALPGPDDAAPLAGPDPPVWRAAYSAPAALVAHARTVYALDAGRGLVVDLPRPEELRRPQVAPPPGRAAAERRVREQDRLTEALSETQEQLRAARSELDRTRVEARARIAESDQARRAAEARLRDATRALERSERVARERDEAVVAARGARERLQRAHARVEQLEAALSEAREAAPAAGRVEELQARLAEATQRAAAAERAEQEADALRARLDQAEAARSDAERAAQAAVAELRELRAAHQQAREQARAAREAAEQAGAG
ncbi:MAG TPA: hypothetical protein VGW75_06865, partial [Solirubrobacteraceae bacterium]|nr:hypothetical protein [Solirubrobacteraceae bacterium]